MTEHTDQIRRRFSGPEWARAEALGFEVPEIGRTAIANDRAKREAGEAYVAGCTRPPRPRKPRATVRGWRVRRAAA